MKNFYNKGISLPEVLVVIAIIVIMMAVAIPQFSKMREKQILSNAVSDIISSIDKAKSQTLSSLNSYNYGVHFQSDKIIIFRGSTFSSNDVNNENINFVLPATISNISLSGGGSDIYFTRLTGMPSKSGTVTVSTNSFSKIITISTTGSASIN